MARTASVFSGGYTLSSQHPFLLSCSIMMGLALTELHMVPLPMQEIIDLILSVEFLDDLASSTGS